MSQILSFLSSSIGRKVSMAITGLLLILFLVAHLAGNLLVFVGAGPFNQYSHTLISNPLIYVAELGLLAIFLLHLAAGVSVFLRSRGARPEGYKQQQWAGATSHKSVSSSTMILSGAFIAVFLPLHIAKFKFGKYYAGPDGTRDLYRLVIETFQNPGFVIFYVIAMLIVGLHLWHALGSAFESLGINYRKPLRRFGQAVAILIATGFLLLPIGIFVIGDKL
jgi:succinate dehydrogenase / fumarate reductase cytochrome b subunit